MEGCLVKWIHDLEPTNLCVIIEEMTEAGAKFVTTQNVLEEIIGDKNEL